MGQEQRVRATTTAFILDFFDWKVPSSDARFQLGEDGTILIDTSRALSPAGVNQILFKSNGLNLDRWTGFTNAGSTTKLNEDIGELANVLQDGTTYKTVVLMGSNEEYVAAEIEALRDFIDAGGRVIVINESFTGQQDSINAQALQSSNAALCEIGSSIQLDGSGVTDSAGVNQNPPNTAAGTFNLPLSNSADPGPPPYPFCTSGGVPVLDGPHDVVMAQYGAPADIVPESLNSIVGDVASGTAAC